MLRVTLPHARPGMVLSIPVHHPRHPEVVLLKSGAALDSHSIPRLKELFVQDVWIQYPGLEELVRFVNPQVLAGYRDLTTTVGVALDTAMVQSRVDLDFYSYKKAVMSVLDRLIDKPHAAVFVTELVGGDRPYVRHAGNVCVLSLLMGLKLEFYLIRERAKLSVNSARDISGLGVGAMFHDLGMSRLDPQTLARWNQTHDEDDGAWQKHVGIGFDLVKSDLDPAAAAIVLHHHQKFDGSGFPKRGVQNGAEVFKGSDIHVFARIVACADLYDRLRHPANAPGANAEKDRSIPGVRVLNMMRKQPYCDWVDPVVFLALLAVCPPYPPGSIVTLLGGRKAAVVDWTALDPCRPVVAPLSADVVGGDEPRERIDLRTRKDLHIVAIDGQDVSEDNFYPKTPAEFDLARVGKAMSTGVPVPVSTPESVAKPPVAAPAPKPASVPAKAKGVPKSTATAHRVRH
jgi:HD-GYP domain-containing protein (c-di-GMP phosphodiesterase class II)